MAMSERPQAFATEYGMAWYPEDAESIITVERLSTVNGRAVLQITARTRDQDIDNASCLQVSISKKGCRIRTYPVRGDVGEYDE